MGKMDTHEAGSFEELVLRVYDPLQLYIRRRTDSASAAEDVLGEVLLIMWRRLADIPSGSELPWCYGTARKCLANARRRSRRHRLLIDKVAERTEQQRTHEGSSPIAAMLGRLSKKDREIVRLWAWEDLSAAEIGAVLGVTPNAASIRLHRALKRLQAEAVEHDPGHSRSNDSDEKPLTPMKD